jgi:uncharacterized repeat protein (TIGR03803 family)
MNIKIAILKGRAIRLLSVVTWAILCAGISLCGPRAAAQEDYQFTTLATFNGANGALPICTLVPDGQGGYLGTAAGGGAYSAGTLFDWTPTAGLQTLASFDGTDGGGPAGALTAAGNGTFYGTTGASSVNGVQGPGTLFQYTAAGGLQAAASLPGYAWFNALAADGSGNYYGLTENGGAYKDGTIFQFSPSGGVTVLASFGGSGAPSAPKGSLIYAGNGQFYGTTEGGGQYGYGTIFEWSAATGIQTLASFNGYDGGEPYAGLVTDGHGNFYGTTTFGGGVGRYGSPTGYGGVFKWSAAGGIQQLGTFTVAMGYGSPAALIMDASGNLYGTTGGDGPNRPGTVYECTPGSGVNILVTFPSGETLGVAEGGLYMDGQGDIFGTTYSGGPANDGTVFEMTPFVTPGPNALAVFAGAGAAGLSWLRLRRRPAHRRRA